LDNQVIEQCAGVLAGTSTHAAINMRITNEDRAFSSTLSYHIAL
jgi:glutamate synthase (NADH)